MAILKYVLGRHDSHTDVRPSNWSRHIIPADMCVRNGKAYVVGIAKQWSDCLGYEVVRINGVPVTSLLSDIERITRYATQPLAIYTLLKPCI